MENKKKHRELTRTCFFVLLKNLKLRDLFHVNSLSISAGLEKVFERNRSTAHWRIRLIHLSETVISDTPFCALSARTTIYARKNVLRALSRK